MGVGDEPQHDRQRQQGHGSHMRAVSERQLGDGPGQCEQQQRTADAQCPGRAAQDGRGARHTLRIAGGGSVGDLPHTAVVDAHLGHGANQIDDGGERAHQAEACRAEQHRHDLGANDADGQVQDGSAADPG